MGDSKKEWGVLIMASSVIFDQSRLRAYDGMMRLCEYSGETQEWCGQLWNAMLLDPELYEAFVYYLEHHGFSEKLKCEGYSLIDCYVWEMERIICAGILVKIRKRVIRKIWFCMHSG